MTKAYKEAQPRIPSQRERILEALRNSGKDGVLNTELQKIAIRWIARVQELYQQGYKIDVTLVGNGVYKYTLIEEPDVILKPKKAMDIFFEKAKQSYGEQLSLDQLKTLLSEEGLHIVRKVGSFKH